jgi:hypothetical protein
MRFVASDGVVMAGSWWWGGKGKGLGRRRARNEYYYYCDWRTRRIGGARHAAEAGGEMEMDGWRMKGREREKKMICNAARKDAAVDDDDGLLTGMMMTGWRDDGMTGWRVMGWWDDRGEGLSYRSRETTTWRKS